MAFALRRDICSITRLSFAIYFNRVIYCVCLGKNVGKETLGAIKVIDISLEMGKAVKIDYHVIHAHHKKYPCNLDVEHTLFLT